MGLKLNGIQVLALEKLRFCRYIHPKTRAVLDKLGITKPGYAGLTSVGFAVYNEAWCRRILGGKVEFKKVYRF